MYRIIKAYLEILSTKSIPMGRFGRGLGFKVFKLKWLQIKVTTL